MSTINNYLNKKESQTEPLNLIIHNTGIPIYHSLRKYDIYIDELHSLLLFMHVLIIKLLLFAQSLNLLPQTLILRLILCYIIEENLNKMDFFKLFLSFHLWYNYIIDLYVIKIFK